jgi:hypothetical protein
MYTSTPIYTMQAARQHLGVRSEGGVELIFETSVHEE